MATLAQSSAQLKAYKDKVTAMKKEIDRMKKELAKKEVLVKALEDVIRNKEPQLVSAKEPAGRYTTSTAAGKSVTVNGIRFDNARSAAAFIAQEELKAGNIRNKATIDKEIRRYLRGYRPSWTMYGAYEIK